MQGRICPRCNCEFFGSGDMCQSCAYPTKFCKACNEPYNPGTWKSKSIRIVICTKCGTENDFLSQAKERLRILLESIEQRNNINDQNSEN